MKKYIKHLYYNTTIGHLLLYPVKKLYDIFVFRIMPEKMFLKRTFKILLGYELNLENPKTLNEKIQWLKLNDRTPLHTLCADRYAVREYVKQKIGEQYLIPLIYHTNNPADIIPENLPDYPFIIKTNHGCGGHVIVKDKSKIDWRMARKKLKKSLKHNHYYLFKEWPYKNIKPRIIVEKLLLDKNSNIPHDYKITCCNGRVVWITVIRDRYTDAKINFYDPDWKRVDYVDNLYKPGKDFEKPKNLTKMKSLAETLAKDFRFARIDLYNIESKIYFGEITFHPKAGFDIYDPPEWDRIYGDELIL